MADSKLKIDIRRGAILDRLRREGRVCVSELSAELSATAVTIRNDLAALERDGYLTRMRGGAVQVPRPATSEGFLSAAPSGANFSHMGKPYVSKGKL